MLRKICCRLLVLQDLVKLLDALFLCFDKLSEQFQLVKIETVFETYLAAAGKKFELSPFRIPCFVYRSVVWACANWA